MKNIFGYIALTVVFVVAGIVALKFTFPSDATDGEESNIIRFTNRVETNESSTQTTVIIEAPVIGDNSIIKGDQTKSPVQNNAATTARKVAENTTVVTDKAEIPVIPSASQPQQKPPEEAKQTEKSTTSPATTPKTTQDKAPTVSFPLNLNTATKAELMQISGIGSVTADNIIAYRTKIGGFKSYEQLDEVTKIGKAKLESFRPFLYVENDTGSGSVQTEKTDSNETITSKININTASASQLENITGVGPAIAQRIIDYRNENGQFKSIEDIKKVKGIGDKTFPKMKDEITV